MTVSNASHMRNLVSVMEMDSACGMFVTTTQEAAGIQAIESMRDAGCAFPDTHADAEAAVLNLDSIYWRLAAGEHSEMLAEFSQYAGFAELNAVLSEIFEGA